MNKTLNINLAGFIFHIDEDAFHQLENYLNKIKAQFASAEGGDEIIQDIESRIAELFRAKTAEAKEVINRSDVAEVIKTMGQPEDYLDADEAYESKQRHSTHEPFSYNRSRTIYRDADRRIIGGVAAGLAHYFKIDPLWMRLLFVALFFAGFGTIVYIILWIVVPKATTTAEKLQMHGEVVNISNIERSIRDEMDAVGGSVKNFARKASQHDYAQYSRKSGNFFSDLGRFIGMAARTIFRVLGRIIGFCLVLFAFVVLMGIIAGMLTGGFHALGSNMGFWSLIDFFELITIDDFHQSNLLIGLVLITVAPLFLFVYLGLRMLFDLQPLNSSARNGLLIAIFIGIVMLIVSGSRIALSLNESGSHTNQLDLVNQSDTLYIEVNEDAIYQEFKSYNFNPYWMVIDHQNIFREIELNVYKSDDSTNKLLTQVRANGSTRREARAFSKKLEYGVVEVDNHLVLDNYYVLDSNSRYRGQEVQHKLYIKEGTRLFLHDNTVDIIYDIKNVHNMWDHDMVNHWWEMTPRGLECLDCLPVKEPVWPDEVEIETDSLESTPEEEEYEEGNGRVAFTTLSCSGFIRKAYSLVLEPNINVAL